MQDREITRCSAVRQEEGHPLDPIDRRIVELLTANGRLSYAELARQIGLSGPAVHERVGKLESSGVIRAYRAHLDPEAVGLGVTASVSYTHLTLPTILRV